VQEATGESLELAYVDQGYTGEAAAEAAQAHGIQLEVVKHLALLRQVWRVLKTKAVVTLRAVQVPWLVENL
jgi:hypothetical protein